MSTGYQVATPTGVSVVSGPSIALPGSAGGVVNFTDVQFGGSNLYQGGSDLVTASTYTDASGVTHQDVALDAMWNTIKDIEIANLDTQALTVTGFVDTWIPAGADNANRTVEVDAAKRGCVELGDGNDNVAINYMSNDTSWSNLFNVNVGDGNDTISVKPITWAAMSKLDYNTSWSYNYAIQHTTSIITAGNGNDNIDLESSGSVNVGSGTDFIKLVDGVHSVQLGAGSDTVAISAANLQMPQTAAFSTQRDVNDIFFGSGHASVSINDTSGSAPGSQVPLTNLVIAKGGVGGGTDATADVVNYGHADAATGNFIGGNWSALSIDLTGYSAGSSASLVAAGNHTDLRVQDAATGSVDLLALYGSVPASTAALHVSFN
jgi:hypothetical protein